jgi:hypothetical protein
MPEDKFEINCYFKLTPTTSVPFRLQITKDKLIISARTDENKEPCYSSLGVIKAIDKFLHRTTPHEFSDECEKPEKIVFYLRWIPK